MEVKVANDTSVMTGSEVVVVEEMEVVVTGIVVVESTVE